MTHNRFTGGEVLLNTFELLHYALLKELDDVRLSFSSFHNLMAINTNQQTPQSL